MSTLRSALLRYHPRQQPVYVVTTPAGEAPKHLFGVHRPVAPQSDIYQSHVLGFRSEHHAELLARSLESYYLKHGCFPPRDMPTATRFLDSLVPCHTPCKNVAVERMDLPELLVRLRGTGIVVTLVTPAGERKLSCEDVRAGATYLATVSNLNRAWAETASQQSLPSGTGSAMDLPKLLPQLKLQPKPRWPPRSENNKAPLILQVLAAWFFKVLVLIELMAGFLLVPTFF